MRTLVWLRNDLRVHDNPALFFAAEARQGVVAVYVHCEEDVQRHDIAPCRTDFVRRHLQVLAPALEQLHITLHVMVAERVTDIPGQLLALAQAMQCEQLLFNAEYPWNELQRDRAVANAFREQHIAVRRFHDRLIMRPGQIRTGKGEAYKVFTPFKRNWLQKVMQATPQPLGKPVSQSRTITQKPGATVSGLMPLASLFAQTPLQDMASLWPAGEEYALQRLKNFVNNGLSRYHETRDLPAVPGTSTLSPYLAVGALSPRQCLAAVLGHAQGDWSRLGEGANTWVNELIWREFYNHLVVDFPAVCKYRPMQAYTDAFPWRHDPKLFQAWCEGRTGVPIVDAAMRQLLATGWMHNRLRMITAMFLTKNLRIDWRQGEAWFMSHLIDGDFAANNGGWQWSASTGTDAAPYFRIFNPFTQSQRFDPDGTFLRTYLPELAHLPAKQIHQPPATPGYPAPVVDVAASRRETIELFAALTATH